MLPVIEILDRQIGSYAILAFMGFIVCGFVIFYSCKQLKIDDIVILELMIAGGILVGGHLLYGIVNLPQIIAVLKNAGTAGFDATLTELLNCFGGMVFYGGFLGGLTALQIYIRITKAQSEIMDIYAFSIPLFHFFGRIGCFLAGCCYGIESDFGLIIYTNPLVPDINGVRRFPVALTEAAFNICIFIMIFGLFKKGILKNRLLYIYMIAYPCVRFFVEFLRGDSIRGIYHGLSTSQWISIALWIAGIVMLCRKSRKKEAAYQC